MDQLFNVAATGKSRSLKTKHQCLNFASQSVVQRMFLDLDFWSNSRSLKIKGITYIRNRRFNHSYRKLGILVCSSIPDNSSRDGVRKRITFLAVGFQLLLNNP